MRARVGQVGKRHQSKAIAIITSLQVRGLLNYPKKAGLCVAGPLTKNRGWNTKLLEAAVLRSGLQEAPGILRELPVRRLLLVRVGDPVATCCERNPPWLRYRHTLGAKSGNKLECTQGSIPRKPQGMVYFRGRHSLIPCCTGK